MSAGGPSRVGSYHIHTWGCQMNVHDSEKLAGVLEREGYVPASGEHDADVILLNTCSIREKAAEKVFSELGRLRRLKADNANLLLGVCGCVAQQEGEGIYKRAPYVDFVVGPRAIEAIGPALARIRDGGSSGLRLTDTEYRQDSIRFPFDEIRRVGESRAKAFVTIIEGCNHRCTYCIVPTTRGREVYRPMPDVLAEVRTLASKGVVEVEFLGQTVNAYRDATGNTLAELLLETAAVDGVRRIRFTTSHPAQMTEPLMDAMAAAQPKVCAYLHLPVQSGSSRVLRAMRRGYDRETYLAKIEALRARIPDMLFGTDVIVGFPGETEDDFLQTMTLLDAVRFDTVYSFAYSPRPGTRALELEDDLPPARKHERLQRLQEHQKGIQATRMAAWRGRTVEVLVEGRSKRNEDRWTGRTVESRVVNFVGDTAPGRLEWVEITETTPFSLTGRVSATELDRHRLAPL
jgi:tRNA-2-methylthio-N6-dimethylallyladenosine synthase